MVQEQLGFSQPGDAEKLAKVKAKTNDKLWPWRDAEGFRKLLIVLSEHGVPASFQSAPQFPFAHLSQPRISSRIEGCAY